LQTQNRKLADKRQGDEKTDKNKPAAKSFLGGKSFLAAKSFLANAAFVAVACCLVSQVSCLVSQFRHAAALPESAPTKG